MRHRKAGKKLGRNPTHRLALYRNLAAALFANERIVTTVAKAKAVRPFVEKLITLARKNTLHARRLVISRLGPSSNTQVHPGDPDDAATDTRTVVMKLFDDIAPRFAARPGGYTRVVKRHYRRLGDAGPTAFLELLKEGENKVRLRQPRQQPAAPQVEREEEPTPQEPTPPASESSAAQQPTPLAEGTAPSGEQPPAGGQEPPKA